MFGSGLDAELAAVDAKTPAQVRGKQMLVLSKWLGTKSMYRDPATNAKGEASSEGSSGPVKL
jgi:hypothetical protein